jgi:hypothetical protein
VHRGLHGAGERRGGRRALNAHVERHLGDANELAGGGAPVLIAGGLLDLLLRRAESLEPRHLAQLAFLHKKTGLSNSANLNSILTFEFECNLILLNDILYNIPNTA